MRESVETRQAPVAVVAAIVVAVGVAVGACSGSAASTPDAHPAPFVDPRAAVCDTVEAGATPSFDVIQQMFVDDCASCHSIGVDLNLSPGVAWGDLVNHPAPQAEACGGVLVVPGDPSSSYLYEKLTSDTPCSGHRMPWDEFGPRPLPSCAIALVRNWIAAGAAGPSDGGGQ